MAHRTERRSNALPGAPRLLPGALELYRKFQLRENAMSEPKWTPGPYRVYRVGHIETRLTDLGPEETYPIVANGEVIARGASKSNAYLLAAAPELYAALAAVLGWLDDNPTGLGMLAATNNARQVLAKARGEQT